MLSRDSEDENLLKICVWTCDMTSRSYFGKQNSTLGSVVPLAMFLLSNGFDLADDILVVLACYPGSYCDWARHVPVMRRLRRWKRAYVRWWFDTEGPWKVEWDIWVVEREAGSKAAEMRWRNRANWGLSLQQPRNRNKSATTAWKWKQVNKSLVIALLNRLCSMTNLKEQSRTATALYVCSFQNTPLRWREGFFGGWRERLFWQKKFCKGGTLQLVKTNLAQAKDHLLTLGASTIWAGVAN